MQLTPDEKIEMMRDLKSLVAKLDILRNFMIVADEGLRQQNSAMNDEIIMIMRDVNTSLLKWLRMVEK